MKNLFYDGFNSKLIETAMFEGFMEIPVLEAPSEIRIPTVAVPFSKRKYWTKSDEMIVFYENDPEFREFVSIPQNFAEEMKNVEIISTPDCSLYVDMPLWEQIANIGVSRSVGYYLQHEEGKYVIPNVRWGDERTYKKAIFDMPLAFSGIPQNSIVSVGTYGCSKTREEKYFLEAGLDAMLTTLTPSDVIVYGSCNPKIFAQYENYTNIHHLPDWTSYKKGRVNR